MPSWLTDLIALDIRVTLLGIARSLFFSPSSEFSHVPSHATISLLNMPHPPLSPGVSMNGTFRPTLLARLTDRTGMSTTIGVRGLLGGAYTTIGPGGGARMLGARLRLRAREGATDIPRLFLRFRVGVKLEEALDGDEGS